MASVLLALIGRRQTVADDAHARASPLVPYSF